MKLTKDEARMLSNLLWDEKESLSEYVGEDKQERIKAVNAFEDLSRRLKHFSYDERRIGRKSRNDFSDCLKRIVKRYENNLAKELSILEPVKELSQKELKARALIAGDLLVEGEVARVECFRIEMDAALGKNTGDLKFEKNTDFEDGTM